MSGRVPPAQIAALLLGGAGLAGAVGVSLAALAAHVVPNPLMTTAAQMLLLHAGAVLGLVAVGLLTPRRGLWFIAAAGMLMGVGIFAGTLTAAALNDTRPGGLAPTGGGLLILSWLLVVAGGVRLLVNLRRGTALTTLFRTAGGEETKNDTPPETKRTLH